MFVTQVKSRRAKAETKLERRKEVRQELWSAHLKSPTFALSEALRREDVWEDAGSSAGGSRR